MRTRIALLAVVVVLLGLLTLNAFVPRYVLDGEGVRDRWTQEYCPMTEVSAEVLRDHPREATTATCPSGKDLVTMGDGRWFVLD